MNHSNTCDASDPLMSTMEKLVDGDKPRREGDKRVTLGRAVSMTIERIPLSMSPRYRSASPSLRSRWRNQRQDGGMLAIGDTLHEEEAGDYSLCMEHGESPPADEMVYFDNFEKMVPEELRVKICKDGIRQNLLDFIKSNVGSIHILEDIESGKISVENVVEECGSKTQLEKNIAFLWSAFLKKSELLTGLLKCGADIHYTDSDGFSALHLAAFSCCVDSCKFLISRGANVNLIQKRYTPLHSAAFGNSLEAAKLLLKNGAKVEYYKNGIVGDGTALHSAVKANATECLQLLMRECTDVNSVEPSGCSPLHLAADLGHTQCLKVLLNFEGVDPNVKTRDKQATALHLAAENGYSECLSILLSKGADASERDSRQQTALHLAARVQSVECVDVLLTSGGCDPNALNNEHRTPLHCAVGKALQAYEVAEILIQWHADVNAKDKYGYTALHIAALNELSHCVETLLYYGADICAKTKGGTSALSIIVRKTPASLAMMYQKLDSAISMHDPEVSHREVELKLDFRLLVQHCNKGEIGFLKTFVDEGQKEILEHPLCQAFLYLKWDKIRKYYIARMAFCFIFVVFLTLYVMSALAHNCYNDVPLHLNGTPSAVDLCPNSSTIGGILRANPIIIEVEWYILLILTIFEGFRKMYGFAGHSSIRQYVEQPENIIEWLVFLSVFAISCIYTGRTYTWQNHVGAFAVLFGWTNLMLMIGQLPLLGNYVEMYMKVQIEFAKLFMAYSCLLIGFTISFCVIFPTSGSFSHPFIGFIKVLVMMTGELEFEDLLIGEKKSEVLLEISAHIIFVVFLLFVTVVLMNLLVGIAVHDIHGLRTTAGLSKLERQTRLISYIELALFNGYLPHYVLRLLRWTALVSPAAYRVVLHVKPLNPREKRLPKDVLKAAYEVAKQRKHNKHNKHTVSSRISTSTTSTFINAHGGGIFGDGMASSGVTQTPEFSANMQNLYVGVEEGAKAINKLTEEVTELKKLIASNQVKMIELFETFLKKDTDC